MYFHYIRISEQKKQCRRSKEESILRIECFYDTLMNIKSVILVTNLFRRSVIESYGRWQSMDLADRNTAAHCRDVFGDYRNCFCICIPCASEDGRREGEQEGKACAVYNGTF